MKSRQYFNQGLLILNFEIFFRKNENTEYRLNIIRNLFALIFIDDIYALKFFFLKPDIWHHYMA